jgi:hypothetical protein
VLISSEGCIFLALDVYVCVYSAAQNKRPDCLATQSAARDFLTLQSGRVSMWAFNREMLTLSAKHFKDW